MMKIIAVHLLNDFSGSPLVLSQLLRGFAEKKTDIDLFTSDTKGFLSDIEGVNQNTIPYHWSSLKLLTLFHFLLFNAKLFSKIIRYSNQDVKIYINTLLPFGAALAGYFIRKKVIYHVHETSIKPAILKRFLRWVVKISAMEIIYVSSFLKEKETIRGVPSKVIYNSLSHEFLKKVKIDTHKQDFRVLMLCSLKKYKGTEQFIALARKTNFIQFDLVLNATEEEVKDYVIKSDMPDNCFIYPATDDVHAFYRKASVVINLSLPDQWLETFGMTILEGMHYRLPAIVPHAGGPRELVEHGKNGFLVDPYNIDDIQKYLHKYFSDHQLYLNHSHYAAQVARQFSFQQQLSVVHNLLMS